MSVSQSRAVPDPSLTRPPTEEAILAGCHRDYSGLQLFKECLLWISTVEVFTREEQTDPATVFPCALQKCSKLFTVLLFRIAALSGCCFTLPCICVDANELQQLQSPRDSGVIAGSHGGNCGQGVPQGMQEHPNTLASKQHDDGDEPGFGSALACPLCKRSLSLNQCYASGLYTNGFIFHP